MTSLVKNGRLRRQWRVPLGGVWLVGTAHWAGTIEPGRDPSGIQGTCSCGSSHLHWRFLKEIFKNFPRTREHTQRERFKKNKKKTNSFWWVGVLRKYFFLVSLYFLTINNFVFLWTFLLPLRCHDYWLLGSGIILTKRSIEDPLSGRRKLIGILDWNISISIMRYNLYVLILSYYLEQKG